MVSHTARPLLYEVSIIRPLVIFLLVVYHALCPYTGGWVPPSGVEDNGLYWWLGHLISGFRIETIAFVGGYVFAYQCIALNRRMAPHHFVWKKFKRLIIPCWIFGVAYLLLFRYKLSMTFHVCAWKVLNGIGHLWFLPMLFWCFVITWGIDQLLHLQADSSQERNGQRRLESLILLILAIITLLKTPALRLGLTRVPHFLFYFYLGYFVWHRIGRDHSASRQALLRWGFAALVLYIGFLLLHIRMTTPSRMGLSPLKVSAEVKAALPLLIRFVTLLQTSCGIMALYLLVMCWLRHKNEGCPEGCYSPPKWVIWCSKVCYGTYVFHMFFMQWLYFETGLPAHIVASPLGAWMLPWGIALVVFIASIATTQLLLKTRTGRFLIG